MGRGALKGLDGLAFISPALFFFVGLFAESAGEPAITIMTIVGAVGMVGALYSAWYALRFVMNLADDAGLSFGLPYAALWMLRGVSAFWLWMALALFVLGRIHEDWSDVLNRASLMSVSIGVIVFAIGVGWFVVYAWSKQNVNRSSNG